MTGNEISETLASALDSSFSISSIQTSRNPNCESHAQHITPFLVWPSHEKLYQIVHTFHRQYSCGFTAEARYALCN